MKLLVHPLIDQNLGENGGSQTKTISAALVHTLVNPNLIGPSP